MSQMGREPHGRHESGLSLRQRRETEYHRKRADEHKYLISQPVNLSSVRSSSTYRWWNAYWVILRKAKSLGLTGKSTLVIGCGFGDDAIQLSFLGAMVSAIDISEESIDIAQKRARKAGTAIRFAVSAGENLPYPDAAFDLIYLPDIIHHIDIARAMREVRRVLKPKGVILGNEPYTHSCVQAIRQSRLVHDILYARMVKWIYGTDTPYITVDEKKLDEHDFRIIEQHLDIIDKDYFLLFSGRLVPATFAFQAKLDRLILTIPLVGHLLAGRIVFTARSR